MTERGIEPSGSHGSALSNDNDHLNNDNPRAPNRSSRSNSSLSWKRYLACIAITSLLCLIQFGTSIKNLTTTTADTLYSQIMDLPSVQSEVQQTTDGNANNDLSSIDYFINITTPQPLPTLVHFDPRFIGGYRNQHMRFVAFVNFAVENSIPQLLLPSLRWGVPQGEHKGRDVPFEYLFDVAYWNERAERAGLPRLVRYDASVLEGRRRRRRSGPTDMMDNNNKSTTIACFNTSSKLYSGLDSGLLRNPNTNIRRVNIWDEIGRLDGYAHCRRLPPSSVGQQEQEDVGDEFTHLIPHGGSKGVGRLVSSWSF